MRVTTTSFLRHSGTRLILLLCGVLFLPTLPAQGMTDIYQLSRTTGTAIDMSGASTIYGGCVRYSNGGSSLRNIGFSFDFDGRSYTQFSVNASGHMTLGQTAGSYYYSPRFPEYSSQMRFPTIAPAWFSYGGTSPSGSVRYKVSGTAPNRILTVEWSNVQYYYYQCYSSSSSYSRFRGNFQARLYEGSNRIEFWYGDMWESSSYSYYTAIGIATSDSRYISVRGNNFPSEIYVNGSSPTYNYHQLSSDPISYNTLYVFNPCQKSLEIAGDVDNGGTTGMKEGDVLLTDMSTQRGSSESFFPFSIGNPDNGCEPISYWATFSGAAAADYAMVPGTAGIGESISPEITFTPQALGERRATMAIYTSTGQRLSYVVSATGLTRMAWIGDVSEGGVDGMVDGSTILSNIEVARGESRDVTPFTIENTNTDPTQFSADITYVLDDPLDEYTLSVPNGTVSGSATRQTGLVSLGVGEYSQPIITFSPTADGNEYGSGIQEATLTVIADGEERTFPVAAFAVAPALTLSMEGVDVITSDRNFFRNIVTCVGEEATVLELTLENTNRVDVVLDAFEIYEVDSRVQQGAPRYPMSLDNFGNLIRSDDYVLSMAPGVAPASDNPKVAFPLTIAPGERRTYFLTYVAQRPGKRYARAFLRTNAVNFYGPDLANFMPESVPVGTSEGLMTLEFYGRGLGSGLASGADGNATGLSLIFDPVKVGESIEGEVPIHNTGECDLRISVDKAHLTTGDVDEFELLEVLAGAARVGQDYVIPAGGSATIKARFTPSRSGSRRATVLLQTNDSTVGVSGISAPGVYNLNLYGVGRAELRALDLVLAPAVIDGPGSRGVVRVENTSSEVIRLSGATLAGADVNEIIQDASNPWPVLPVQMQPGDVLEFGVALNALSGSESGLRSAEMVFTYGEGEIIRAGVSGLVGSRLLTATPGTLFDGVDIPVGNVVRRMVVLSNTGTFPVLLKDTRVEGDASAHYEVRHSGRTVIDAGGFEFVEVTYTPSNVGNHGATLVIENNGIGGPITIMLNGTSVGTSPVGGGSANGARIDEPVEGAERSAGATGSLELSVAPNPMRTGAEVTISVATEGDARLVLYGLDGTEKMVLFEGDIASGSERLALESHRLAAGTYLLRLEQGGRIVSRTITVVR